MNLYQRIIDYIKSYSNSEVNPLEWEDDSMVYTHPFKGIEKSNIFNHGGISFDINKIKEMSDEELYNVLEYVGEYENTNRFRVRRYYGEDDEPYVGPSFRYYTVNNDDILPFASGIYFREVRQELNNEARERRMKKRNQNANDLIPILKKFIEKHRENNPTLYPDWLTFNFYEVSYGDLIAQPIVNIEKLLKSGDRLGTAKNTRNLLERIWNRLLNSDVYRRERTNMRNVKPKLRFTNVKFDDWNSYMKNVVNKQIKPEIRNIPRASACLHSIIFRFRGGIDYIEIQIHPRFKQDCSGYWHSFNKNDFNRSMRDILESYGWKRGINYSDSTYRD